MTRSPNLATDMLIETAHRAASVFEYADDQIADRLGNHSEHIEDLTGLLADHLADVKGAVREFTHYSDGRRIGHTEVVDDRIHVCHIFEAVPRHHGERLLYSCPRPRDPEEPDRGHYRVYVDDVAATLRVEVFGPLEDVLG